MTIENLTTVLAERVMEWKAGPDRFLTANRSWIPRWKFNPLERIQDAFVLVDRSESNRYSIVKANEALEVEIQCKGGVGRATGHLKARTITLALARSLGIKV